MSAEKSFSEALDWYESALSSNPDKSPIHPSNLRAWYNKGVTLFRNGDPIGSLEAFGIIVGEMNKNSTTLPTGIASVLNTMGTIYFKVNHFASAIERFTESLSLENECLSPCQRAGVLCNIATAYYRLEHYEESESFCRKALIIAHSLGQTSHHLKATIMCKLGYLFYRKKDYPRAHSLFSDGKSRLYVLLSFLPIATRKSTCPHAFPRPKLH